MSQLGWVDFSSEERDKVKLVLAALNEPGTLDELGIGQIRDVFANRLFPGISTIQTRAKYFITIARLLRDIQHGKAKKANKAPADWLEQQEHLLAELLVKQHGDSETGIIGAESIANGGVSRRPSSIYWNGLKTFGIVKTPLSLREFCHELGTNIQTVHTGLAEHDDGQDDTDVHQSHSAIALPDQNEHWQAEDQLSITLSRKEATFLKEKIACTAEIEHSVPAQILRNGGMLKLLRADAEDKMTETATTLDFDGLTSVLLRQHKISPLCRQRVRHAQSFSLAMEGPHLRFNILLAMINQAAEQVEKLEQEFQVWLAMVQQQNLLHDNCVADWFCVLDGSRIKQISASISKASRVAVCASVSSIARSMVPSADQSGTVIHCGHHLTQIFRIAPHLIETAGTPGVHPVKADKI